jgi:hypothetical protein
MIQPETWKTITEYSSKLWAIAGPLFGVLLGAYLTTRTQRKHWVLDNRRAEFRKLLTTLTRAYSTITNIMSRPVRSGHQEEKCEQMRLLALNVIRDRIFIAPEVIEIGLLEKWNEAVLSFNKDRDYKLFATRFSGIVDLVRGKATKLIK